MKILRLIGMAMLAVLMCVNFTSCSNGDDGPTEGGGGVIVGGKKLTKTICKPDKGSATETNTFNYDNNGRLIAATIKHVEDGYSSTNTYQFTWGDDAITVTETSTGESSNGDNYSNTHTYKLILRNGLVQYEDYDGDNDGDTGNYTYNSSNRFIKFSYEEYWTVNAIWNGDKLVSASGGGADVTLTYDQSCSKGYFPFIAAIIKVGRCGVIYMAHPEIAGMRMTQLPAITTRSNTDYTGQTESYTSNITYEFDQEGYISKIIEKETDSDGSTETYTYTLTWQ